MSSASATITPFPSPASNEDANNLAKALFITRTKPRKVMPRLLRHTPAPIIVLGLFLLAAMTDPEWLTSAGGVLPVGIFSALTWLVAESSVVSRASSAILVFIAAGSAAVTWLFLTNGFEVAGTAFQATAAIVVGFALARHVLRLAWLAPLALGASLSDAYSVYFGATKGFLESAHAAPEQTVTAPSTVHIIDVLVLRLPTIDGTWMLGTIDILFIALMFGVAREYDLPIYRSIVAVIISFSFAWLAPGAVPVLPFIFAAFVIAHGSRLIGHLKYAAYRVALPFHPV